MPGNKLFVLGGGGPIESITDMFAPKSSILQNTKRDHLSNLPNLSQLKPSDLL